MKKYMCYLILLIVFGCVSNEVDNKVRLEKYIGNTVGFYLSDQINSEFEKIHILDEPPGVAGSLLVSYNNKISIELIPSEFKYMKRFDTKGKWDIEKFKLETIKKILVFKNDSLIHEIQ